MLVAFFFFSLVDFFKSTSTAINVLDPTLLLNDSTPISMSPHYASLTLLNLLDLIAFDSISPYISFSTYISLVLLVSKNSKLINHLLNLSLFNYSFNFSYFLNIRLRLKFMPYISHHTLLS